MPLVSDNREVIFVGGEGKVRQAAEIFHISCEVQPAAPDKTDAHFLANFLTLKVSDLVGMNIERFCECNIGRIKRAQQAS